MARRHPIPSLTDCIQQSKHELFPLMQLCAAEANRTDRYLSWEEMRKHLPPDGLTYKDWWCGLKLNRSTGRFKIPLVSTRGFHFNYACNNFVLKALHEIDTKMGGTLYSDSRRPLLHSGGDFYLVCSLEEESIMSSLIEGACVTRSDAKAMIRENRSPIDKNELMVLNNYRTMQQIKAWKDESITPDRVLALHRFMTEGTLKPEHVGVLRTDEDDVRVENEITQEVAHIPPPAAELPQRLRDMCDFAMDEDTFIHPVLKAIILHFWLAYDHPFVDGNGRTARALFYWMMLRHDFRLFEYVTISHQIRRSSAKYNAAFLDTEDDDGDLNHFICNQLQTILKAIDNLYAYVKRKNEEQQDLRVHLRNVEGLNHRQKQILIEMAENPDRGMTVESHRQQFDISLPTSRNDLSALVAAGFLTSRKQGKNQLYTPVPDIREKLFRMAED